MKSLSGPTFFGLTQEYRLSLFSQIHEIVFHGKGGYDWETIYNMPIWLRRFTFEKINKHYKELKEMQEDNKGLSDPSKVLRPPSIPSNTYTTKTSPKK